MIFKKIAIGIWLAIALATSSINAKELSKIEIEYVNFDKISVQNLLGYLGNEYRLNFNVHPKYQEIPLSVHMQNGNMKGLLDMVAEQSGLTYVQNNNIVTFTSKQEFLESNYYGGTLNTAQVTVKYTALSDAINFLVDMMPGRAVINSSSKNLAYSNLVNMTPDLSIQPMKAATSTEGASVAPGIEGANNSGSSASTASTSTAATSSANTPAASSDTALQNSNIPRDVLYIVPYFNENMVFLSSSKPELIAEAKKLLKKIDRPMKQVLIQAEIIEMTLGDNYHSFFDFIIKDSKSSALGKVLSSTGSIGNISYMFLSSNIQANIDIAKHNGKATSISSPVLLTLNRISSKLDLTEERYVVTGIEKGSVTTNEGGSVVIPPTPIYEKKQLGTQFGITPFINENNEILLKIDAEISSLSGKTQTIVIPIATGGTQSYTIDGISKYTIKSLLSTTDKKGIVLGGMIREQNSINESKVPVLGDIPVFGTIFKKTANDKSRRELIMVLTPTIIDPNNPKENKVRQDIRNELQDNLTYKDTFCYDPESAESSRHNGQKPYIGK
ncbi:MAG: hypothetical protein JXQ77_06015 [Campylobacterales bacterium]|nr:hypothetical protein [Campylobacterales bacterium]